jgi:hypothetical protein
MKRMLLSALAVAATFMTLGAQPLPPPSYSNTVHLLLDAPGFWGTGADLAADAGQISLLPSGPYARLGVYGGVVVDMPWGSPAPGTPLSSPDATILRTILSRAEGLGLAVHFVALAGMSRAPEVYVPAFAEDRRNAQWFGDGTIQKTNPNFSWGNGTWASPSRYARKLRRHMEAKVRAYAALLVSLRKSYPDTFVSASGDGEAELNWGGLDTTVPPEEQEVADYSPFAVLEFRDWIENAGLYAPGQLFEGQGLPEGGPVFQGEEGLGRFNRSYGTTLTTWSLRYFDWSLADPVDGDPGALDGATVSGAGWSPLPTSGLAYVEGGFDPPRAGRFSSLAFWNLWRKFREELVRHYVGDFVRWVTTTPDSTGTTFEPERWFAHQFPADYLQETWPGGTQPSARLFTSGSPFRTSLGMGYGRMGLTVFDVFDGTRTVSTSLYLVPDIQKLGITGWGLMEYSPAWPMGGSDPDVPAITARIRAAYDAGARVFCFQTWPLMWTSTNQPAFTAFLNSVKLRPAPSPAAWTPPTVTGLRGERALGTLSLRWGHDATVGMASVAWTDHPGFSHFEVLRGASRDFAVAAAQLVGTTRTPELAGVVEDASHAFYRVLAVTTAGVRGVASEPWAAGFFTLMPCRVLDTRESSGPAAGSPALLAGETRSFVLGGRCNVPENAAAVSVNVTIANPAGSGDVRIVPGDYAHSPATTITIRPGADRANNALLYLATDGLGTVSVRNDSSGPLHLILDVNGFFQ